jgi:hypothetical protein
MENTYNFIKITLLGLILGVLIVILLNLNDWVADISKTTKQSATYQTKEYSQKPLEKHDSRPPILILPSTPKHKI